MNLALLALLVPGLRQDALTQFGDNYGLTIEVRQADFTDQARGYTVSGKAASPEAVKAYGELWMKEWSLYPADLMKKAKVKRIVFCEGLRVGEQFRAACPAFDLDTMYYDPAAGSGSRQYQRSVVHHEFFHMIDQRMKLLYIDPEWTALNGEGFKYGNGGANMRNGNAGALTKDIPGFLTPYGTSGVEEDKAELFAKVIVEDKFVAERLAEDKVLMAKLELLKKRLAEFLPSMGEEFWDGVIKQNALSNEDAPIRVIR